MKIDITLTIYYKAKKNNTLPELIPMDGWKKISSDKEDFIRHMNRILLKIDSTIFNTYCLLIDFEWDDNKSTIYCYSLKEFMYFISGFSMYHRLLTGR